jgi:tetratricopeptide (TPR) repeat protein
MDLARRGRRLNWFFWGLFVIAAGATGYIIYRDSERREAENHAKMAELSRFEKARPEVAELQDAKQQLAEAIVWLEGGQGDKAEPLLMALQEKRPDLPGLRLRLGQLALIQLRFADAVHWGREAIDRAEDLHLSHYLCGVAHAKLGEYEKAEEQFRASAAIADWNASVIFNWALALRSLNRFDDAIHQFELARTMAPGMAEIQMKLLLTRLEAGQIDRVQEAIQDVLKWEPDNGTFLMLAGVVAARQGRTEDAIAHFRAARAVLQPSELAGFTEDRCFAELAAQPAYQETLAVPALDPK